MTSLKLRGSRENIMVIKDHELKGLPESLYPMWTGKQPQLLESSITLHKQELTVKRPGQEYKCFVPSELLEMFTMLFESVRAVYLAGGEVSNKYPVLRPTVYMVNNVFDGVKFEWFNRNGGVVMSNSMQLWSEETWED